MLHFTAAVLSFAATFVVPTDPKLPAKIDPKARAIAILEKWEKQIAKTDSFIAKDVVRTDKERGQIKTWKGELRYIRPNYMALRLVLQEDPKLYELLVQTDGSLYEFRPQCQKLVIHELRSDRSDILESCLGWILADLSVWDVILHRERIPPESFHDSLTQFKARHDIVVTRDISADNPHYIYVKATPKPAKDNRGFTQLQLVFNASTMNLRRLWIARPNDTEVTWDFPNFDTDTTIKPADFAPPAAPKGWTTERQPQPDQASK